MATAPAASTTKFIQREPETGFITIEATADLFGTARLGWFTIIVGGIDQQIFLYNGFPNAGIEDRVRITYDPNVPDELQGPKGTAGYMTGVIVSMEVIGKGSATPR